MQLAARTIFLTLLISTSIFAQNRSSKSPSEIAREQSKAVVVLEALDERGSVLGQGSGFIVTPGGAVVSNLHVVQGAAMVRVKLPNGDAYKTADLVEVDDAKDIVVVKIKGFKLPVVTLGDSDKAEVGEQVVAISSPEGLTNSISTGVISGVRRFDTHRVFQLTAPISNGSSGGALFNSNGEVIGIITYLFKSGQNINFAVPINYARGLIGDQATKTLAQLQPAPETKESTKPAPSLVDPADDNEQIDG
ncbi:MAG: S1C family serine protease, partial [Blastocatellia bacterium]